MKTTEKPNQNEFIDGEYHFSGSARGYDDAAYIPAAEATVTPPRYYCGKAKRRSSDEKCGNSLKHASDKMRYCVIRPGTLAAICLGCVVVGGICGAVLLNAASGKDISVLASDNISSIASSMVIGSEEKAPSESFEASEPAPDVYFGAHLQSVTTSAARYYGLEEGVFIRQIDPDSAAETCGLLPGDVITAVDGAPVAYSDEVYRIISEKQASGQAVSVTVFRSGDFSEFSLCFK